MPAAVDPDRLAGDEVAVDEREHGFRHLEFAAPSAKRRRTLDGCELLVRYALRRHDWSRGHRGYQNLIAGELEGQRLGQGNHARFRNVIRQITGIARPPASRDPVSEVEDPSAAQTAHVRNRGARAQPRAT